MDIKKKRVGSVEQHLTDFFGVFDEGLLHHFNSLLVKNDELDNLDYKSYYSCCKRVYSIWELSTFSFFLFQQTFSLPWKQFYQITVLCSYGYGKYKKDLELENKLLLDACRKGFSEIVPLLINNGANVDTNLYYNADWDDDSDTDSPLDYACREGHLSVVKLLVSFDCTLDDTAILYSVGEGGNYDMIKYLIDQGMDLSENGEACLECFAEYKQDFESVKYLYEQLQKLQKEGSLANKLDDDTLASCCRGCSIEIVEYLVGKGLNPNAIGYSDSTSLAEALKFGNFEIAKHLILKYKSKIEDTSIYHIVEARNRTGLVSYHEILEDKKIDMLNFLFENYSEEIPLQILSNCANFCVKTKWYKILVWFLKKGANIDSESFVNIAKEGNFNLFILISQYQSGKKFDFQNFEEFEKNVNS